MEFEMILRLMVAGVLGAMIGFEREAKLKEAGLRTHFLVALGSALFMIVSKYAFGDILNKHGMGLDPSRIAAQVVSGVGFLGAGTIIIQRKTVRGLTTAAGIWATSGIGLSVGAGLYWIGCGATVLALIGLEILDRSVKFLLSGTVAKPLRITIHLENQVMISSIVDNLLERGIQIFSYQVDLSEKHKEKNMIELKFALTLPAGLSTAQLLAEIQGIPGIISLHIE